MKVTHVEITDAQNALSVAQENLIAYINHLRDLRHNEFVTKGGCVSCNGYGRVCTWSTMDGSSWDEFGVCPNPSCTAKNTGRDITKREPGTHNRTVDVRTFPQSKNETDTFTQLEQSVENAQEVLQSVTEKWIPSKGKEIEVTRSSKGASKGDKGIVFWTGVSEFQPYRGGYITKTLKVGFKTSEGITCWTTGKSCRVINPNVESEKSTLVCATVKKETSKAYLMMINSKEVWVPKSVVKKLNEVGYIIPHWFLDKNGLR